LKFDLKFQTSKALNSAILSNHQFAWEVGWYYALIHTTRTGKILGFILILFGVRRRALPNFGSEANTAFWRVFFIFIRKKGFNTCRPPMPLEIRKISEFSALEFCGGSF
jgi:hypothetical protein